MKYDFTTIMDRHGMDAIAVDAVGAPGFSITAPKEGFDVIPMWVADMNFPQYPPFPQRSSSVHSIWLTATFPPVQNILMPS